MKRTIALAAALGLVFSASAEARGMYHRHRSGAEQSQVQFLAHPAGCPRTKFCGCGVAEHIFGSPIRALWTAASWLAFPRTQPAPGMVAVFGRHHVAAIEQTYSDGTAILYDPNSGGHQTRLHRRSIRGAVIVNPHGSRYAARHHRYRHVVREVMPHSPAQSAGPHKTTPPVNAAGGSVILASWYGEPQRTASGERFDPNAMTAAMWDVPFGTKVRVCRDADCVQVRVNDRGPARRLHRGIDLSAAAAKQLHMTEIGVAKVRYEIVQ